MAVSTESTGRRWKLAILVCFLGVIVAIAGMLTTGSVFFLWIGVAAAIGLLVGGIGAWLTSG